MWTRLKTLLLGPLCTAGCGAHVFPKDVEWHREKCAAQEMRR